MVSSCNRYGLQATTAASTHARCRRRRIDARTPREHPFYSLAGEVANTGPLRTRVLTARLPTFAGGPAIDGGGVLLHRRRTGLHALLEPLPLSARHSGLRECGVDALGNFMTKEEWMYHTFTCANFVTRCK